MSELIYLYLGISFVYYFVLLVLLVIDMRAKKQAINVDDPKTVAVASMASILFALVWPITTIYLMTYTFFVYANKYWLAPTPPPEKKG